MKVKTGTLAKYMAMAEPHLPEWSPIWFAVKPRISGTQKGLLLLFVFLEDSPLVAGRGSALQVYIVSLIELAENKIREWKVIYQ
jgi:hypothetical protein